MDASIKNNIATSISHVHIHNKPITKTLYHAVNVMSTEANYLSLDVVSTRLPILLVSQKSLSLLIQFMLQERFSICHLILSKVMQLLFLKSFEPSLL